MEKGQRNTLGQIMWEAAWPSDKGRWTCNLETPGSSPAPRPRLVNSQLIFLLPIGIFNNFIFSFHLTNRRQFSMVYTLIDHKMTSENVQNSSETTSRRRVVSLPSFGHFMASFYGL